MTGKRKSPICMKSNCRRRTTARGLCRKHYALEHKWHRINQYPLIHALPANFMNHECVKHKPSVVCYVNCKCRCDDCRLERSSYERKRIADRLIGKPRLIDVTPARKHLIDQLARPGVTMASCSREIGIKVETLKEIKNGKLRRTSPENVFAIVKWYGVGWCKNCGRGKISEGVSDYCSDCLNAGKHLAKG